MLLQSPSVMKRISKPIRKNDWKKFEKNNLTITLNVLHEKETEICPAHNLQYNWNREKQIILLMISNGKKWNYLGIKKSSSLRV